MEQQQQQGQEPKILLEITLISAQDLKSPLSLPPSLLHSYATIAVTGDPSASLLRTRTDLSGGRNPTWNDKFVFLLPTSALSSAALLIRLLAAAPRCLPDPLLGTVTLLLSAHRPRPHSGPTVASVGIRRPSGRFHGVLNVALMLLPRVPNAVAAAALSTSNAVAYRDLMRAAPAAGSPRVLREINREMVVHKSDEQNKLRGLRRMQIQSSPLDQNLGVFKGHGDRRDDGEEKKR